MQTTQKNLMNRSLVPFLLIVITLLSPFEAFSEVSTDSNEDFSSNPVNLIKGGDVPPRVMINLSNDHQLYYKAFNDYSDLDGDSTIETTYKHSIDYYGYFDSGKCYDYNSTDLYFEPKAFTDSNNYCTGTNSGYWSGNFLNWATMARIDVVRKLLLGGHRRVDTASKTVLERTYLPTDTHSWAKHYDGADLQNLTPFSPGSGYDCDQSDTTLCGGDPLKYGITIGNTTDHISSSASISQDVIEPPLIKVVKGNYSLWAVSERWQITWRPAVLPADVSPNVEHNGYNNNNPASSGINAYKNSPYWTDRVGEGNYVARVQACVSGLEGNEKCKSYPGTDGISGTADDNLKPIGLIQVFGDDDRMLFGMIAGGYDTHASGGVLIKNMESLSEEINIDTDGTFSQVAEFAGGPLTNNTADGFINALSLYRIINYNTETGWYDECSYSWRDFDDLTNSKNCQNWGNPFAEIYYQALNYFSKGQPIGPYRSTSSNVIPGLPTPQPFEDPLDDDSWCAPLFMVNFNSSSTSYDADELDGNDYRPATMWDESALPNGDSTTTQQMTDFVGEKEGLHGNDFFFGYTDVENETGDGVCTAKKMTTLGQTGGICPEAGRHYGSYRIAGLAYYAHIADIRPDDDSVRGLESMQNIDTYSLAMATATPTIEIPHPLDISKKAVTLMPACRDQRHTPHGNCSIVGFKIVSQELNNGGIGTGKLFVAWEVGDAGGDFDQDMWGTIDYEINDNTSTFTVTTKVFGQSSGGLMGLAYILDGTDDDGFHAHSGINGFTWTDTADTGSTNCTTGCLIGDAASTKSYTLGSSTANLLKDPLWYASKWGGFVDSNSNQIPDLVTEWDREINATGQDGSDGIPDTYFYANNPNELETSLARVFNEILERVSSGTAAAVVSNNVRGEGLLYQAFYEPSAKDDDGNEATWVGTVRALWLDSYGYLREDTDQNAEMGNYDEDLVIESYYDDIEARTRIRVWSSSDPDNFIPSSSTIIELDEVEAIWSASESLSDLIANSVDVTSQRTYNTSFQNNGRYIFTWIDDDSAGTVGAVDSGETLPFDASTFSTTGYGYLNVADTTSATNLVNYIRGLEQSGMRNRTIDHDNTASTPDVSLILGDIINSTPTVVGKPQEGLHLLYKDASYAEFYVKYKDRRTVIYAGANDGMLHAFNGGFADSSTKVTVGDGSVTNHELGAELWAYVPQNLLPHLKWLSLPDYQHVYYVDGKPRVVDAKIFDPTDGIHPNGWGTVLIVGMRLGGGPITVDTDADGLAGNNTDSDTTDDRTFSSAYILMDITDPERPPTLLAEFTLPDNSYTTVYPTFFKIKDLNAATDPNKWFLMFGSGPDNHITAESNSSAKVYIVPPLEMRTGIKQSTLSAITDTGLDLVADCSLDSSTAFNFLICDTKQANTFMGDPIAVDWELDYKDDALYFGTVGDENSTVGSFYRLALDGDQDPANWKEPRVLYDAQLPISAAATVSIDDLNNHWVYFGSGRIWSQGDLSSTATQSLFGMKDYYDPATPPPSQLVTADLLNSTDIKIVNFMRGNVTAYDSTNFTTSMLVSTLQGTAGDGPFQSWSVENFRSLESGISNSSNTLDIVGSTKDFLFHPSTVGDTPADDILVWTTDGNLVNAPAGYQTFDQLEQGIDDEIWDGWYINLAPINGVSGTDPATRSTTQSALIGGSLFTSVYQPSIDPCESEGFSQLYGVYYKTGTAHPDRLAFAVQYDSSTDTFTENRIDLGLGFATAPSIHSGSGTGSDTVSVFTQLSTGSIERRVGGLVHSARSGWLSWRCNQ